MTMNGGDDEKKTNEPETIAMDSETVQLMIGTMSDDDNVSDTSRMKVMIISSEFWMKNGLRIKLFISRMIRR
ncbi:hypothetical protein Hdeb2414_s0002g00064411 [Helianthus debilis subsp. tardiflorus]